jgi:hypothetical protein
MNAATMLQNATNAPALTNSQQESRAKPLTQLTRPLCESIYKIAGADLPQSCFSVGRKNTIAQLLRSMSEGKYLYFDSFYLCW